MNRLLFTLAIMLFSLTTLPAQYFNKYVEDGEKLFLQEDFYGAYFYYGAALDIREDVDIRYKYAESARLFSLFSDAEDSYWKLIEMRDSSGIQIPPDVGFQLAMVTKQLGKYEEAHELFENYVNGSSTGDPLAEIAAKEAEICLQVISRIQSPDKTYAVRNIDTTGVVINSGIPNLPPTSMTICYTIPPTDSAILKRRFARDGRIKKY
jgi:tetratricopeptide (TPR) repeat protein